MDDKVGDRGAWCVPVCDMCSHVCTCSCVLMCLCVFVHRCAVTCECVLVYSVHLCVGMPLCPCVPMCPHIFLGAGMCAHQPCLVEQQEKASQEHGS